MVTVYKLGLVNGGPNFWTTSMRPENREKCDLTCLKYILIGENPVSDILLESVRMVDIKSKNNILERNQKGRHWLQVAMIFKGYLNNKQATDEVFLEDGWLRTGDIVYKDENFYFYFVDRLKSLINCKGHTISPSEPETVIRNHLGLIDVAVTVSPIHNMENSLCSP